VIDASLGGYRPPPWLPGAHLQTIVPYFWPAPAVGGRAESRIVHVDGRSSVRIDVARPEGLPRGTLLLVHGLGGSADSNYMRRTAQYALSRGWLAVRMNLRTCGGTEALSATLYNAGQSDDVDRVLGELDRLGMSRPFAVAGFSLGGNIVLRYAGLAGSSARADAVAGVNPPIELDRCLRSLERPSNALYHMAFLSMLCAHLRRIRSFREVPGPASTTWTIGSLRRFDSFFTAPDGGYASAEDYYARASAAPAIGGIRVPALVLSSANDPFVPSATFDELRRHAQPPVRVALARQGGHVGYWQRDAERFWAGRALMDFVEAALL